MLQIQCFYLKGLGLHDEHSHDDEHDDEEEESSNLGTQRAIGSYVAVIFFVKYNRL